MHDEPRMREATARRILRNISSFSRRGAVRRGSIRPAECRRHIRARGRAAAFVDARVVQARDVRMFETARMSRSRAMRSAIPRSTRPRCGSFSATCAGSIRRRARPARPTTCRPPELAQQSIRPDEDPGPTVERRRHGAELGQAVAASRRSRSRASRQQLRQRLAHVRVLGRQRRQPGRALRGREVQRLVQQRAQSFPVGGGDRHRSGGFCGTDGKTQRPKPRTFSATCAASRQRSPSPSRAARSGR